MSVAFTPDELREVALRYAASPELWRHHVRHDHSRRTYREIHRDARLAVWLICWMEEHDTGFHDHDRSAGGVAVAAGRVREERLVLGGAPSAREFGPGGAFAFDAWDIHRVLHAGAAPAVTIHAYSPPLSRMGAYETAPTGELRRHSMTDADELRPLVSSPVQPAAAGR